MSAATLRIIQMIADASPTGAPKHVAQLLTGLREHFPGAELELICPDGWLADAMHSGAKVTTQTFGSGLDRATQADLLALVTTSLRDAGPETPMIVHLHGNRAGIAGRLALRELVKTNPNLKLIYTEHQWTRDFHLPSRVREFAQLRLLRQLDRVTSKTIAVSQAVADFLLTKKITPAEKLVVVPHGIALPAQPAPIRDVRDGRYRLGMIASLTPLKRLGDMIAALPLILQNDPKTELEVIGDGEERSALEKQLRQLHVSEQVKILGFLPETHSHLTTWDLFVSTSQSESFGLAVAEAMATGLPVVAARGGAIPELVTEATGRLVPVGAPHELAKTIIDLLPQVEKRRQLGAAGRERVATHFSLEKMLTKMIELYTEISS